ncbi:MAG: PsbP-related protein [bacterium]|nr:PsbP-related protein [bacterium]
MENNFQEQTQPNQLGQQLPAQQPPIDEIPPSKSKFKLILFIVILLLVVGGGAYYLGAKQNKQIVEDKLTVQNQQVAENNNVTKNKLTTQNEQKQITPTPDPTANWKTYMSKYNTYSIKYPQNWYIYEYKQGGGTGISDIPNPEDMPHTISPQGHTLIIVGELFPSIPIPKDASSKQFSINSYTGLRSDQTTSYGSGEIVDFYNPNRGNNVELAKYVDENNMFDQILSTFKFIDQNQTTTLTPDQIFSEASSQLGITRSKLTYFRIFGQDKVQYDDVFAYKQEGVWRIAQQGTQSVAECSSLNSVPEQYQPPCLDINGKLNYVDSSNRSINYPPSSMTSYLKEP